MHKTQSEPLLPPRRRTEREGCDAARTVVDERCRGTPTAGTASQASEGQKDRNDKAPSRMLSTQAVLDIPRSHFTGRAHHEAKACRPSLRDDYFISLLTAVTFVVMFETALSRPHTS